jgi:hypothetical protein
VHRNPKFTQQETIMFTRLPPAFISAALAGGLALASSPVFAAESAAESPFPAGTYASVGHKMTMAFDGKGQFVVTESAITQVSGRYTVTAGRLELTDLQGPWACTHAGQQTGTYSWKYANSVLTFSKVADRCEDRVQSLTTTDWKQQ